MVFPPALYVNESEKCVNISKYFGVCHNSLETTLKQWRNPASPRDNTCQFLGLIFSCNKVIVVDPVIFGRNIENNGRYCLECIRTNLILCICLLLVKAETTCSFGILQKNLLDNSWFQAKNTCSKERRFPNPSNWLQKRQKNHTNKPPGKHRNSYHFCLGVLWLVKFMVQINTASNLSTGHGENCARLVALLMKKPKGSVCMS